MLGRKETEKEGLHAYSAGWGQREESKGLCGQLSSCAPIRDGDKAGLSERGQKQREVREGLRWLREPGPSNLPEDRIYHGYHSGGRRRVWG